MGKMEGDSGKYIAVDTMLRVNNIKYKRALCHNCQIWTTDKKGCPKTECGTQEIFKAHS
jgi:hypothetical protein